MNGGDCDWHDWHDCEAHNLGQCTYTLDSGNTTLDDNAIPDFLVIFCCTNVFQLGHVQKYPSNNRKPTNGATQ